MSKLYFFVAALLVPVFVFAQSTPTPNTKTESLKIEWPESDHWKVGKDQSDNRMHSVDMVHENESLALWTEMANSTSLKGMLYIPVDTAMYFMFLSAIAKAPDAKLTMVKKGEMQECPWILFSIEAPEFKTDPIPESQLWFVVQGKQGLYTNFVALKKEKLPDDFLKKWTDFFLKTRLSYN